jgi:hypothetical protein
MAHRRTKRHRSRKHKTRKYRKQRGGEDNVHSSQSVTPSETVVPSQPNDVNDEIGDAKKSVTDSVTGWFGSLGSLFSSTPETQQPEKPTTPTGGKRRRKRRTNRR